MQVEIVGHLDNVESYEGKNGFGSNVTVSQKVGKRTTSVTFGTRSKAQYEQLVEMLDTDVVINVDLVQSNFGLRFGNINSIGA